MIRVVEPVPSTLKVMGMIAWQDFDTERASQILTRVGTEVPTTPHSRLETYCIVTLIMWQNSFRYQAKRGNAGNREARAFETHTISQKRFARYTNLPFCIPIKTNPKDCIFSYAVFFYILLQEIKRKEMRQET